MQLQSVLGQGGWALPPCCRKSALRTATEVYEFDGESFAQLKSSTSSWCRAGVVQPSTVPRQLLPVPCWDRRIQNG